VDVQPESSGWLAVGRRQLPFPGDERDRYASRFHAVAIQHGGALTQFAEETSEVSPAPRAQTSGEGCS
jgi:hypothetical protein